MQIFLFKTTPPDFEKELVFGRDLYRNNLAVVFDNDYKLPMKYQKYVKKQLIL